MWRTSTRPTARRRPPPPFRWLEAWARCRAWSRARRPLAPRCHRQQRPRCQRRRRGLQQQQPPPLLRRPPPPPPPPPRWTTTTARLRRRPRLRRRRRRQRNRREPVGDGMERGGLDFRPSSPLAAHLGQPRAALLGTHYARVRRKGRGTLGKPGIVQSAHDLGQRQRQLGHKKQHRPSVRALLQRVHLLVLRTPLEQLRAQAHKV